MTGPRSSPADRLPAFPWDSLEGAKARASAFPGGLVDLSVGTPVDEVPAPVREALAGAAAGPGYPRATGTAELRGAIADFMRCRHGVGGLGESGPGGVMPVIGTKEAIASLPMFLGVGPGDRVVVPELAYPTYEVAARLAGAEVVRADSLTQLGPTLPSSAPALMFVNSPANPSGRILGVDHLRKVVAWARERGVIVVSDECYLGLAWDAEAPSILDERVCGGDATGLLAVHSLSKTMNMASYRAGWLAGDGELVRRLLEVRRHAGLMVPGPVQAAMVRALSDDAAMDLQRSRYAGRRSVLRAAVEAAGFRVDDSVGGLYLWLTRDDGGDAGPEHCRDLVDWFAERGILVAPGEFYGPKGARHVRMSMTCTDEAADAVARRLRT